LSTAVLTWIAISMAVLVTVAGLGWAGVFDGDDSAGGFHGTVVDAYTGDPLAGATVTPTDEAGAPISALAVVTAANGAYAITGLTSDEYGLLVNGAPIGHQSGYVALTVGPHGHTVVATWGAAATYAPGVIGDIALDPLAMPTTTVPQSSTTSTTAPVAGLAPATTAPAVIGPTTTAGFRGPTIGEIHATPSLVTPSRLCSGSTTTQFSVTATHPSGVKSVVVQWSYPTAPVGAGPGTASGTATLTPAPGGDTWTGGASFWQQPAQAPQTWITLKVIATANDTYYRSRTFAQALAIKHC
jgi:hypothetical protein